MGFLVSPGVDVNEIDLTNVIPAVSTSIGGIVGHFKWGPVEEVVSVGSEKELVANFGKPDDNTYKQWFQASAFLQYGNALNVYRTAATGAKNANNAGASTINVKNTNHYLNQEASLGADSPETTFFVARYPGALGNSLQVCVVTANNWTSVIDPVAKSAVDQPTGNDFHIVVIDEDGEITGTANTVLETYLDLSSTETSKRLASEGGDGSSNYYKNVLEASSAWIWPTAANIGDDSPVSGGNYSLTGGVDATTVPGTDDLAGDYATAFGDAELIDVNILIAPVGDVLNSPLGNTDLVADTAKSRKDCVAVLSPPTTGTGGTAAQSTQATALANTIAWASNIDSNSYAILSSTAVYVYDKYNDVYRWIGSAGHLAGLLANVDDVAEPWFSPAGYNRGQLRGVVKLGYNPTQADRNTLYKARINPLVSFPGQGTLLFGDKTAQSKPSAFDRINVRRLFIVLEKAISTASKYQLFELNDEFTRAMFRNMTEPFLRDVKGRRGITDFLVICDETNNTAEVIDSNRFVADIYIKPARSINFITLNFIATRTGVEFSEIAGQQ